MTSQHQNITFIGMSGVGKSTFGKLIAKQLNYNFSDTDKIIEKQNTISIPNYISNFGEAAFLNSEESIICNIIFNPPHVIATGGSVVYSEKIMSYLRSISTIIYLSDSIENIKKRIKQFSARGVIMNSKKTIDDVYLERQRLYTKFADITVQIPSPFNIKAGVEAIVNKLS